MTAKIGWRWVLISIFCILLADRAGAISYTLTVSAQGSGTVTKNPTNSTYPRHSIVMVTATPDAGWYFANWSGDARGAANPTNVEMLADMVVTGNFLPFPTYTLTLATNGQGTIGLNPAGGSYLSNSVITATATPAAGWVFISWSGSTNSSANPLSLTVNTNRSLTGTFAQLPAFDLQPQSVTNVAGSTVSFFTHAVGAPPLEYQWFFSGGSLTGATNNSLTLTNAQLTTAGNYWIVATNSYGAATSSVVLLTLTNSIQITNVLNAPDEASLRAAVKIGGWVSITFNGTITLTNTINITNDVILDAQNVSATISGGSAVRLFYVAPSVTFCATNLTLANGSCIVTSGPAGTPADAGAIYNDGGTVTLVGCTLTNNNARSPIPLGLARGGAIFNNGGTVSLCQSAISNNAAVGGGGSGFIFPSITPSGLGGAIFSTNGSLTIAGCNVSGNFCQGICIYDGAGLTMGGAVFQASGSLTINNSSFTSNQALGGNGSSFSSPSPAYGGALANNGGSSTIEHSQFFANTAEGGNAGYHTGGGEAFGGAVYSAAALTVKNSSFAGNQALGGNNAINFGANAGGGAIYNSGTAVLNNCSVYSNYTQGGSSYSYLGPASTGGNGWGGGIFNASQIVAANCTIALNAGTGGPGVNFFSTPGTNGDAIGGGVFNSAGATFVGMNLTIASNSCSSPSGDLFTNGTAAGVQIANTNGTLRLHNSLIAYGGTNGNAFGVITDDGYNISSDGSANFNGGSSFNFTDPLLGPLADYGGPTLCMALLPDSPAIDWCANAGAPPTDQRGYARPAGDAVDVGAYEYLAVPLQALSLSCAANKLEIDFAGYPSSPPMTYYVQASTNLSTWTTISTNGPFDVWTNVDLPISQPGLKAQYFRLLLVQ